MAQPSVPPLQDSAVMDVPVMIWAGCVRVVGGGSGDPLSSVVLGAGKMLSDFNLLRKISID